MVSISLLYKNNLTKEELSFISKILYELNFSVIKNSPLSGLSKIKKFKIKHFNLNPYLRNGSKLNLKLQRLAKEGLSYRLEFDKKNLKNRILIIEVIFFIFLETTEEKEHYEIKWNYRLTGRKFRYTKSFGIKNFSD